MSTSDRRFRWRSVAIAAFLPTVLFSTGEGAILPVIPMIADDLGASLAIAGFIAAMIVVGELVGDIPSGPVVARLGERTTMIAASGLAAIGLTLAVVARDPWLLGAGIFLVGLASAAFSLARHAFMTTFVPIHVRARALSTLGGTHRLGYMLGPFIGAGVISLTGDPVSAFWVHLVCCGLTVIVLLALRDPEALFGTRVSRRKMTPGEREVAAEAYGLFRTLAAQRQVLFTLGLGALLLSALRTARYIVLPLWAVSLGLDVETTSIIIGVGAAIDFSLFFASGWIMDRFGRIWAAVPALLGLGIGHVVLAFTSESDAAVAWYIAVAMFLSFANGLSSGVLMTLGADLADPRNPAPFLGAWRFTNDAGGATAPLVVAGVTGLVGLPIAVGALGVLGFVGAAIMRVYIPRFVRRP